jgi:hypothetical protein
MSGVKKLGEVAFPEAGLLTSAGGMVHQHPIEQLALLAFSGTHPAGQRIRAPCQTPLPAGEQPIRDQVRAYSSRSASRCAGTYREKLISPQNPA